MKGANYSIPLEVVGLGFSLSKTPNFQQIEKTGKILRIQQSGKDCYIMSKYEFSFWAQNLTNTGDDHAETNGETLKDSENREELAGKISHITLNAKGEKIEKKNISTTIFYDDSYFVLKVVWSQTDNLGRKAPIVCYGKIALSDEQEKFESFINECISLLENFSIKIGRNFSSDEERELLRELIKKSFNNLRRKERKWSWSLKNYLNNKSKKKLMKLQSGTVIPLMIKVLLIIVPILLLVGIGYYLLTND